MAERKIRILKNGPYIVSGSVPINEKIITPQGKSEVVFTEGRVLPQASTYSLCRCGKSRNAPFCDGTHTAINFDGTETASRKPYLERSHCINGENINVRDDDRCAFARFCHSDRGQVGRLIRNPQGREDDAAALRCVQECPAGRLTAYDKEGNELEPELDQTISILQDPSEDVCGPIYVQGRIPIESADGEVYEVRNRVTLCRCGASDNKPFCDARHVQARFTAIEPDAECPAEPGNKTAD
ncbi:MAG: iron-binding protein [Ruminococcaceae bacterium]|nr:iron-binding protein [Oscillospiraceae bacterium]